MIDHLPIKTCGCGVQYRPEEPGQQSCAICRSNLPFGTGKMYWGNLRADRPGGTPATKHEREQKRGG